MKQQHYLSFVLVVINACKAVGVDSLKINRTVLCTLAAVPWLFSKLFPEAKNSFNKTTD